MIPGRTFFQCGPLAVCCYVGKKGRVKFSASPSVSQWQCRTTARGRNSDATCSPNPRQASAPAPNPAEGSRLRSKASAEAPNPNRANLHPKSIWVEPRGQKNPTPVKNRPHYCTNANAPLGWVGGKARCRLDTGLEPKWQRCLHLCSPVS